MRFKLSWTRVVYSVIFFACLLLVSCIDIVPQTLVRYLWLAVRAKLRLFKTMLIYDVTGYDFHSIRHSLSSQPAAKETTLAASYGKNRGNKMARKDKSLRLISYFIFYTCILSYWYMQESGEYINKCVENTIISSMKKISPYIYGMSCQYGHEFYQPGNFSDLVWHILKLVTINDGKDLDTQVYICQFNWGGFSQYHFSTKVYVCEAPMWNSGNLMLHGVLLLAASGLMAAVMAKPGIFLPEYRRKFYIVENLSRPCDWLIQDWRNLHLLLIIM